MAVGSQQSVDQLAAFFMPLHGIYPAPLSCQSAYLQYATIIRRVRPWRKACTRGLSHIGFHAAAVSCASSRHSILRLWRGPSPRAYALGAISYGLSFLLWDCILLCCHANPFPTICDYRQTRSPLEKGAAKGRDRRKRQLSDFCLAGKGNCRKIGILQMAVM